jgi:hypothetical protein
MNKYLLILIFLGTLITLETSAQDVTRIKGTVLDSKTKESLPFVNVTFKGANIGTTTDFDGKYNLETRLYQSFFHYF